MYCIYHYIIYHITKVRQRVREANDFHKVFKTGGLDMDLFIAGPGGS